MEEVLHICQVYSWIINTKNLSLLQERKISYAYRKMLFGITIDSNVSAMIQPDSSSKSRDFLADFGRVWQCGQV